MTTRDNAALKHDSAGELKDFIVNVPIRGGRENETEALTFVHVLTADYDTRQAYIKALKPETYGEEMVAKDMDTVESVIHFCKEAMRVVARTQRDFDRLEETIRDGHGGLDDAGVWNEIFGQYRTATYVGAR